MLNCREFSPLLLIGMAVLFPLRSASTLNAAMPQLASPVQSPSPATLLEVGNRRDSGLLEQLHLLEGDYRWYYPDNGLSYTRTFETIKIRLNESSLFLGEDTADRKRLFHVAGLDFELEHNGNGWSVVYRFEIMGGSVKGLRREFNGASDGRFWEYGKPIERHDPDALRIAAEFVKNLTSQCLPRGMFIPDYASEFFPDQALEVEERIRGLGELTRLDIHKRQEEEDELQYSFLLIYGEQAAVLHLKLTQDHLIRWAWLDTGSEDDPAIRAKAMQFLRDAAEGNFKHDVVDQPMTDAYLAKTRITLVHKLRTLGKPVALNRTKRPGIAVSYLVIFRNASGILDLWFAKDGHISGFNLD